MKRAWLIISCILYSVDTKETWFIKGVGSTQEVHLVARNGNSLGGVCMVTEEGTVSLLDSLTGNFIWRELSNSTLQLPAAVNDKCKYVEVK